MIQEKILKKFNILKLLGRRKKNQHNKTKIQNVLLNYL